MKIEWTAESVHERLELAAKVERVLPPVYYKGYSGRKLDVVREWYELLWDKEDKDRQPRFQPTNEQVSQWEEVVLRWLRMVDNPIDKKILWLKACGMSFHKLSKKLNIERHRLSNEHRDALQRLARKLNASQI